MFKDRFRFILSTVIISVLLLAFYDNISSVIYVIITKNIGAYIMLSLYLVIFVIAFIFVSKSLYIFLMKKKLDKTIFLGLYLLSVNLGYIDAEFNTFPFIDIAIEFALFNKYLIGINFTYILLVLLFKKIFHEAPDSYSLKHKSF